MITYHDVILMMSHDVMMCFDAVSYDVIHKMSLNVMNVMICHDIKL